MKNLIIYLLLCTLLSLLFTPAPALHAEDPERNESDFKPGPLPFAASLVPGALIHGSGHFAGGDPDTAKTLLACEGIGIGLILAGFTSIYLTRASTPYVGASIAAIASGVGMFASSWLADVYGATGGLDTTPLHPMQSFDASLGYRHIYDPNFLYRDFLSLRTAVHVQNWRLEPEAYIAVDDDNRKIRATLSYRYYLPRSEATPRYDMSFLDFQAAGTYHEYGTEFFSVWTGELFINGRLDLYGLSKSMRGSFSEMGLGYGIEAYDYDVPEYEFGQDVSDMLLFRFGFGIYLGKGSGEIMVYYNHRRDDFAGGLAMTGMGGGFMGYVGISGTFYGTRNLGVYLEAQAGSAYILGFGLTYRYL